MAHRQSAALKTAAALALLVLPACTGVEPTAVSAGTSVAQAGVTIFDRGKVRDVELVRYQDAVTAVQRAADRLSLTPTRCDETEGKRNCTAFVDDRGDHLVVVIERRTETMTLIQADVGTFGEILIGTLFIRQVQAELGTGPPQPTGHRPR